MYNSSIKNAWYPVTLAEKLKINIPLSVQLFGEPLVLFRDKDTKPICLQDRCPHRSTPLSLGKVIDGSLECLYHGWQFGKLGKCLKIPSQSFNINISKKCDAYHKRCMEKYGVIWVWADGEEEVNKELFWYEQLNLIEDQNYYYILYDCDINLGHELIVENLLDPAHLPFAHHGTLSKRTDAQTIKFKLLKENNIAGKVEYEKDTKMQHYFRFIGPCIVQLDIIFEYNKVYRQVHYCVPLSERETRLITFQFSNNKKWLFNNKIIRKMARSFSNRVIQQDIKILQGQQKNLDKGAKVLNRSISSDSLVILYRKWFSKNIRPDIWFKGFKN